MRIQIKRDISDNWNSNNPILKSGEFGYDITNNIVKIGDGVTTWKNLSCCNYDDFINKAKSYTDSVIENLIGEAPSTLDTIYEIAQAIQNNQSIIESLNQSIANKVDKVSGKGLSTNDFSNDMKNKLSTAYDHSQKTSGNPHKVTKSDVGLANVDNTSDANKPVSTAQATAIADAKKAGTDAQSSVDTLSGEVETLKTEVNNNTNAISEINDNLSTEDVDVFSGWTIQDSNRIVCDISVNGNDVLYWYLNFSWSNTINGGVIVYYDNSGTKISEDSIYYPATNKMKGNYTVPNNAVKARFILYFENGVTSTKYPTNVYLNKKPTIRGLGNAISNVNSDLDNLSYGEVAGVNNIFKVDTINWTLTDNGIKNNAKNDGYLLGKTKLFAGKTYKISFLVKSVPTASTTFTAYIDGSEYSNCSFVRINTYGSNIKVEKDYTATSDCELLYKLWGNSNSDIFEFQLQVEEGTVVTDYKPYIPSVKMLSDDVSDINSSMSDYGLNNVFDGELEQGGIDSGTKMVKDNYVVTKNKVFCSPNDFIKTFGDNLESSYACFYKSDGTYIGGLNALDGTTVPSDSAYCYVEFKRSGITPSTAGHIGIYINNQIDVLENSKAPINHTHSYAGSSSVGGAATSANKLNTNAGNATSPVYFENGVPKACTYTLSKSVPSDAKFTDTWRGIQDNLTSDSPTYSLSAKQGKALKEMIDDKLSIESTFVQTYIGVLQDVVYADVSSRYIPSKVLDVSSIISDCDEVLTVRILPGSYGDFTVNDFQVYKYDGGIAFIPKYVGGIGSSFNINYIIYYTRIENNKPMSVYSNIATNDYVSNNYLPLSGGTVSGNFIVNGSSRLIGEVLLNNKLVVRQDRGISSDISGSSYHYNLIKNSTSTGKIYSSSGDAKTGIYGTVVGNTSYNTKIDAGDYIYFNGSYVSSSSGFRLSDEKIKSFTDDIEIDKDKIVKLFDLINIKSYTRKDAKTSNKDILNIGVSAQELEESILEVGLDNERYNIIDNHYDYMMSRGENEEDAKYYTKFMTVNYDALYTLSLIKMRVMEYNHNIKLRELEERISKLENK